MATDKILANNGIYLDKLKFITIGQLRDLGYMLSQRQISIGSRPFRYGIMEVVHDDKNVKDVVTFSYLYSTVEKKGVILPYGYDYYLTHPIE